MCACLCHSMQKLLKYSTISVLYEIGIGIDLYLPYFKLSPELKANFGLTNLIVNDGNIYSNSIKEMKTRGFTISLTFE